jgi:4-hydroxybenzoate polyprenyltransferase
MPIAVNPKFASAPGEREVPFAERLRGMIAIMRPSAWIWFDTVPALATLCTIGPEKFDVSATLGLLGGLVLGDAAFCILNDIYDVKTDSLSVEENRRRRPLVSGAISLRTAWYQFFVVMFLSLASVLLFVPRSLPAFVVYLVLVVIYSLPPFKLVARPWSALPFWFMMGMSTYGCVALLAQKWYSETSLIYVSSGALMMAVSGSLAKDIRDWDNDAGADRQTLVVWLGIKRSLTISLMAATASTVGLLVLFLFAPSFTPWSRALGAVCVVGFLVHTLVSARPLRNGYDKPAAVSFYRGHLVAYTLLNLTIVLGLLHELR